MKKSRANERKENVKFWQEHLEKWKESGLFQAEYCRQNKLSHNRFTYWKKEILGREPAVTLVEVPMQRQVGPAFFPVSAPLCLVVPGNYRLEIDKGFDPSTLSEVIRVLRGL